MKEPKVSVVICTYNSGEITRRAIESVLNNNYDNIECIVVDGASNDGTVDIIKSYDSNPKFRYISEPDTGIYNAMNKGWRMAKGEWIHYLGADDELLPNGLHELLDNVNETQFDIIYGHVIVRQSDGKQKLAKCKKYTYLPIHTFACHQGIIMRKSLFKKLNGFDENLKVLADKDLFIRTYKYGKCRYKKTSATVAIFQAGGISSGIKKNLKENWYIYIKNKPSVLFLLYVFQAYTRVFIKRLTSFDRK